MSSVNEPNVYPHVHILGTRGVPAAHGGFETFAERFALDIVARGGRVTVYCQIDVPPGSATKPYIDEWRGVRRVNIPTTATGAFGTMTFDWACIRHAMGEKGLPLVLGYNTAVFTLALRLQGRPVIMNMDGIEWQRAKWSTSSKLWLYLNEKIGARMSSRLIADHPSIADHLATSRDRRDIVTIPYGATSIETAPTAPIEAMGLLPSRYFISIGRIEPENSILEMVTAYAQKPRASKFVCLGKLNPSENRYHAEVIAAGNGRVLFPGAIYDGNIVGALRFHALAYCHGHTVGGTNPSLVEALGAGNAVVAHDNRFNRWVAGDEQLYFADIASCASAFDRIENDPEWGAASRQASRVRFAREFTWEKVLASYQDVCAAFANGRDVGH